MNELNNKLAKLSDLDRAELYRELVDSLGETSTNTVRELVLVYEKSASLDTDSLRKIARSRLPEHERPTRFIATDRLPRTPHGKLDRRALPGLIRSVQPAEENVDASETRSDDILSSAIRTFRSVLTADSVGPDSNFFELGGHSLLAVDCILEFEHKTGKRISISQFLHHPTPRGLSTLLSGQERESYDYIYPVSERHSGLPVFVFSASRLAYTLKAERSDWTIYGVHMRWHDEADEDIRYRSLEDMATRIAAEIRRRCGDSDFVLAGSSFPAMVAFEVARQLRASGTTPNLTILIEPSLFAGIRTWIEQDLAYHGRLREYDNHFIKWVAMNNPFRARFWRRLHRLVSSKRPSATTGGKSMEARMKRVFYETGRIQPLWRTYRPSRYDGPAVLMVGAERDWQFQRDWKKSLGKTCSVHSLDTNHRDILDEPFMSEVVIPIVTSEVDAISD